MDLCVGLFVFVFWGVFFSPVLCLTETKGARKRVRDPS